MKIILIESNKERATTVCIELNRNEIKSAIIGMIIGDGCLSKHKGRKGNKVGNAYYQMKHCAEQYEYLMWKKEILDKVAKCKVWENNHTKDGKEYKGYRLYSRTNPVYTKLYNRFYQYKEKSLDEYLVKMITPLALAIIYMDDGTMGKVYKKHNISKESFYLRLCNFDYANLFLLKKSLKIKFDLDWNIIKHNKKYYQLRLLNRDNEKFIDIIKPYVNMVPCMRYKLNTYISTPDNMV